MNRSQKRSKVKLILFNQGYLYPYTPPKNYFGSASLIDLFHLYNDDFKKGLMSIEINTIDLS